MTVLVASPTLTGRILTIVNQATNSNRGSEPSTQQLHKWQDPLKECSNIPVSSGRHIGLARRSLVTHREGEQQEQ